MLASIKANVGDLSRVKRFVRIMGIVNSTPDFGDQPKVVNGFSDVMIIAFGNGGLAARSAISMNSLPLEAPLEVEATVELND